MKMQMQQHRLGILIIRPHSVFILIGIIFTSYSEPWSRLNNSLSAKLIRTIFFSTYFYLFTVIGLSYSELVVIIVLGPRYGSICRPVANLRVRDSSFKLIPDSWERTQLKSNVCAYVQNNADL